MLRRAVEEDPEANPLARARGPVSPVTVTMLQGRLHSHTSCCWNDTTETIRIVYE